MLLSSIRKTIVRFGLLEKGDKVLIACSGGADSVALTTVLLELRDEYSLRLALAHFNHRLRRAAAADERFVIELARKHDLPLYLRREDVRTYARERGRNLEEAGRERRYAFLREAADRVKADKIATGHTLSDQAETVLMRILRGSGPTGLAGIAPCLDRRIIRPLIEVERDEVEAILRRRKTPYRRDESNQDLRYLRNRVRLRLIPYLQKNFEPKVVRQIGRLAEISREEEDVWEQITRPPLKRALLRKNQGLFLDARRVSAALPALGRRLVRAYLRAVKGDLRRLSFRDVEAVRLLAEGKEAVLPGGLIFKREKGLISLKGKPGSPLEGEYEWSGRGKLAIPGIGVTFTGKRILRERAKRPRHDDERRTLLDSAKLQFPLRVRRRREGDRYRPFGAPGRKKLKEIMRAKGIAVDERDRRPVFLSAGEIVWVPGLPVADAFKVTPATRRIFIIEKQ